MRILCFATALIATAAAFAQTTAPAPLNLLKQNCFACHSKSAMGGVNLEKLLAQPSVGETFDTWKKVVEVLEEKRMPPPKMPQPAEADRAKTVAWIRGRLHDYAVKHDGDPGRITVRRLTSGEYAYSVKDLTGLDWRADGDFVADSAGGEGFTNFGDVQFMDSANFERYLQSAKAIANHAVIGAGPLSFFPDPGKSGFELSALHRIQQIYQTYGFRAASGEGGKPYGLERYARAFYAAWQYRHRAALGEPDVTLAALASREGLTTRFAEHIWKFASQENPSFPSSEVVARFRALPAPKNARDQAAHQAARKGAEEIQKFVIEWPRWLFAAGGVAAGGDGDERALVITDAAIQASPKAKFRYFFRRRQGGNTARVYLNSTAANGRAQDKPLIIWRNAMVRFGRADRSRGEGVPLLSVLDEASKQKLKFGIRPDGGPIQPDEFATDGATSIFFDIVTPKEAAAVGLDIDGELAAAPDSDAVIRCTVADRADLNTGRPPAWALLAMPQSPGYKRWKADVIEYASNLPQASHSEPNPSDKDEIPPPFDNTYNQPERDRFHVKVKYYRLDSFLVEKMLDDATRKRLDEAWNDLLASFEYHDAFLDFVAEKYKLDLKNKGIADLTPAEIEALPAEPRQFVRALRTEYDAVRKAQAIAQPGHINDALEFAEKAWRRPLSSAEKDKLRRFYVNAREIQKLDHDKAIRALLARVLVSPAFLYRLEQPATAPGTPLSNWELASRLSYFLWSSVPDAELRRAAAAGELADDKQLARQARRMLADPKARRFATEFFGQWLGFYRFDQYRGVDTTRFPEFTDEIRNAMYDESVSFFEHLVRQDRPVREMLSADYTFLNKPLAKFYGINKEVKSERAVEMVTGASGFNRGGMLRMGTVLTATSAPLRTSPVKRGDWILRRVLGTPTPPPPADAGSIPADDKEFGGMTVAQKLEAHRRNATCAGCHTRIDPLGFPLERFDAVGRWRNEYADGKPIEDSSVTAHNMRLEGVNGLIRYLESQEKAVLRTFSEKLIGYALGRTVLGSDELLAERLSAAGGNATVSQLVAEIVTSKQFRTRQREQAPATPVTKQLAKAPAPKNPQVEGGR
jgi:mono/diheme cytochrome c family protein